MARTGFSSKGISWKSGTTFPSNPKTGEHFLHTPTGRTIEYEYDGSAWKPLQSYGTMALYVDSVDGTDDLNHGTGIDANAFKTLQYAWDMLPNNIDGSSQIESSYPVIIYLAATTDTENLTFVGPDKIPNHNGRIKIVGILSSVTDGVATGGQKGAGAVVPSVTGTFTAGANEGNLLKFTSGSNNNLYRVIGFTTTTTMYLSGLTLNAQPANLDTYTIYNWGSKINGNLNMHNGVLGVDFYDVEFDAVSGSYGIQIWEACMSQFLHCKVYNNNLVTQSFNASAGSLVLFDNSYMAIVGGRLGFVVENLGCLEINGGKIKGDGTLYCQGIQVSNNGIISRMSGMEISGTWSDILIQSGGVVWLWTESVYSFLHGGSGYGILAQLHGIGWNTGASYVVYGKKLDNSTVDANGTNTSAEAVSYSWLGA